MACSPSHLEVLRHFYIIQFTLLNSESLPYTENLLYRVYILWLHTIDFISISLIHPVPTWTYLKELIGSQSRASKGQRQRNVTTKCLQKKAPLSSYCPGSRTSFSCELTKLVLNTERGLLRPKANVTTSPRSVCSLPMLVDIWHINGQRTKLPSGISHDGTTLTKKRESDLTARAITKLLTTVVE